MNIFKSIFCIIKLINPVLLREYNIILAIIFFEIILIFFSFEVIFIEMYKGVESGEVVIMEEEALWFELDEFCGDIEIIGDIHKS